MGCELVGLFPRARKQCLLCLRSVFPIHTPFWFVGLSPRAGSVTLPSDGVWSIRLILLRWARIPLHPHHLTGLSPCAGEGEVPAPYTSALGVYPRARGGGVWRVSAGELLAGLSPRAWGEADALLADDDEARFIPARAGEGPLPSRARACRYTRILTDCQPSCVIGRCQILCVMASQSRLRRRQAMTGFGSWRMQAEDTVSIRVYFGGCCQVSCVMAVGKSLLWLISCQHLCVIVLSICVYPQRASSGLSPRARGEVPQVSGLKLSNRFILARAGGGYTGHVFKYADRVYPRARGGRSVVRWGQRFQNGLSLRVGEGRTSPRPGGLSPRANFLRLEPGSGGSGLFPPVEGRGRRSSGGSSGEYSFFVLDFASGPGLLISAIMAPSNKSVGRAFARPTDVSSDSAGTMVGGVVLDEASEASWSLKVVCSARRISRAFPLLRFPRLLFFSAGENNRVARMVNFSQRGFPPAPVGLPVYLSPGSGPFHFSSGRKEIYLPCQVFCRHGVVPAQAHGGLLCDEANGSEPRWVAIEETVFGFRTSSSVLDGVILADRQGGRMTPRSGVAVSPWF